MIVRLQSPRRRSVAPSPLSWAEASWTSERASGRLLPEKQENWPRGTLDQLTLPLHRGASNQTRLPSAPFIALHPLSCMGPYGPRSGILSSSHPGSPLSTAGQVRVGPRERQEKPGKKPEGRERTGLPEAPHQVVSGDNAGGDGGSGEGIFPSPSPEPVPHGTGAQGSFLAESGFTKGRRCPHQAGAGGWALPLRRERPGLT